MKVILQKFQNSGYTIIEVLTAVVIFGLISGGLFTALRTGDKIRGRSISLSNASILASNELEILQNRISHGAEPSDSSYKVLLDNREFEVTRSIIQPEQFLEPNNQQNLTELEIKVKIFNDTNDLVVLRTLQGKKP